MSNKENEIRKSIPSIIICKVPKEVPPFKFTKAEIEAGLDKRHLQALLGLELKLTPDATRGDKTFLVLVDDPANQNNQDVLVKRLRKVGKGETAKWFEKALLAIQAGNMPISEADSLPPQPENGIEAPEGLAPSPAASSPQTVEVAEPAPVKVTFLATDCDFRP